MGAAEGAYRAALARIEWVRAEGGTQLRLEGEVFRALARIPVEVAGLPGLRLL